MKKINLKTFKEVLSDKELKEVIAGSGIDCSLNCDPRGFCANTGGITGHCRYVPPYGCVCLGHA
jgi:hypothetical protein